MTDLDAKEVAWVAQLAGSRHEVTAIDEDDAMATSEGVEPVRAAIEAIVAHAVIPPEYTDYYLVRRTDYQALRRLLGHPERLTPEPHP